MLVAHLHARVFDPHFHFHPLFYPRGWDPNPEKKDPRASCVVGESGRNFRAMHGAPSRISLDVLAVVLPRQNAELILLCACV